MTSNASAYAQVGRVREVVEVALGKRSNQVQKTELVSFRPAPDQHKQLARASESLAKGNFVSLSKKK